MRLLSMIIGTIGIVLFFVQISRGKEYDGYVENLDENKFPLASLYTVGFAWSLKGPFKLAGDRANTLKSQASILYSRQYSDYYANIAWAQTITLVHLFVSLTFLLVGAFYNSAALMFVVGVFLTVLGGMYSLTNMKNQLSDRTEKCDAQLADIVSSLAILVNSGMVLREAWYTIADSRDEEIYELMKRAKDNMENGYSDTDAIYIFGKESNSQEIKKFSSVLIQSIEKGGAEIGIFLSNQSSELWSSKRQKMLQAGEKAATKLLLPIMLIFIGVMLIVITAGFAGSLF